MNPPIRPANEIRFGNIKAAVWRNETEGGVRFSVTFTRIYRDADIWRTTDSFGRDDLLIVAKIADQAHTWICSQGRDSRPETPATSSTGSRRDEGNGGVPTLRDVPRTAGRSA